MAWQMGLVEAMKDPSLIVIKSKLGVVIKDKFPKARHHYLVLPQEDIPSIFKVRIRGFPTFRKEIISLSLQLQKRHLDLLCELELLAKNTIEVLGEKEDRFKVGYHAQPSMRHLHLHVVSRDFSSEFLKTKKHWNSFNTEFFVEAPRVRQELEEDGIVAQQSEATLKRWLGQDLLCCGRTFANMPQLKEHIRGEHQ